MTERAKFSQNFSILFLLIILKMLRFNYLLAVAIGLSSVLLIPQSSFGMSAADVAKIAKSSAVTIDSDASHGSGIIIQQQGDRYLVLTVAHVVKSNTQKYEVITADGVHYPLQPTSIQALAGVDLAVVRFTSTKRYQVPKLGNANEATEGTTIYVSGFPTGTEAIERAIFNFTDGKVTANSSKPLKDGYSLIYSNNTLPGMSGGGVFNDKGELVAIHGRGDVDTKITTSEINPEVRVKTGFNLGIPINTFEQLASKLGIITGTEIAAAPKSQPKADDFILAGFDRVSKNDILGSTVEFTKALELAPKNNSARFWRGACRLLLGDAQGAIADLTQTIARNPNKVEAYMYRGSAYAKAGNRQLALADLDRAVALAPKSDVAFGNRCSLKFQLKDYQGAIADCNRAIALNPTDRFYYSSRGSAYYQLDRYREAIADHNISIKLDPKNSLAYLNRGVARIGTGDVSGAIADYDKAQQLETQPRFKAAIYSLRGQANYRTKNLQLALTDFDRSIQLAAAVAEPYFFRGNIYYELGNRRSALADLDRALKLDAKLVEAYLLRGIVRTDAGTPTQAIQDFDTVLKLNPNLTATVLANRGIAKLKLNDNAGATADFDRAIGLDKEIPKAYYYRGLVRAKSRDRQGALADLRAAAALYLKLNNREKYQLTLTKIAELERGKN